MTVSTLALACVLSADAQTYQTPDPAITRIVDAPFTPQVTLSPDQRMLLIQEIQSLPRLAELAEPELKLAGYRIRPATFGPSRAWYATGLAIQDLTGDDSRSITGLPADARLGSVSWSPDGKHVAFVNTDADSISLWVADVESGHARQLADHLNLSAGLSPVWASDSATILAPTRVSTDEQPPQRSRVPAGPVIKENLDGKRPARTYQDLLNNRHDKALFDHYFTAQLAAIKLNGERVSIGEPGVLRSFSISPNDQFILQTRLNRPYSYDVPASRFSYTTSLYGRDGNQVETIVEKPLQDQIPLAFGSVEKGPREHVWRADEPGTLVWAEAADDGDAGSDATVRDRVYAAPVPLRDEPKLLLNLTQRYGGIYWGDDDVAVATSWWWPTRNVRLWRFAPDQSDTEPTLLREYSWQDRYNDPGEPVIRANQYGHDTLLRSADGSSIYFIGDGASEEGDRPFIDRIELKSGTATRLFRSEAPWFEMPVDVLDLDTNRLLTRRENPESPPNYFTRDLDGSDPHQLTDFPHPTPQLNGITKELVRYERDDGVQLSGTLYLPPGYSPDDGPLPTLLWAYPNEYKSADAAGQITDSPYRFVRVGWWSPLLWLTQGYAVLDDPSMPIVGEGDEEPNDTFVPQLVASAEAAIDMLVERGVSDRKRMAIGGHSYGAFMTANLLAHSDLFAAGIARSGAYNRTLTPFGFQAEERTFWESPEIYFAMSPFMHADKINEPMLMIHGEMDNNSGTFPMQSERMFDAMKALGGTVRLVVLPYESHGYRSRESILHAMWETQNWLDSYVGGQ